MHPSGLSPQKLPFPRHRPSRPPCPGSRPSSFSVPHPVTPSFSNLWPSGLGHISLCHDGNMYSNSGRCSRYTRLPIRTLTLRAPSKNPVSSPHANCQHRGKYRNQKQNARQVLGCVLIIPLLWSLPPLPPALLRSGGLGFLLSGRKGALSVVFGHRA